MNSPRLALLSPQIPFPPLSGGTTHILHVIQQLARYYQVDLYALAAEPDSADWGPLALCCARMQAFRPSPAPRMSFPLPAVRQEYSAGLVHALRQAWVRQAPAIVQLEFTTMARYASLVPQRDTLIVCTAHNIAFLAQARRARHEPVLRTRLRRHASALLFWLYEIMALRRCHLIITHGIADEEALRRWLPQLPITTIPSGIDLASWPACFDPGAAPRVLFVGNYLHPPNVEGALWLLDQVWPAVRQRHPGAQLILAGRAPPASLQARAAPDILIPGTVDDLRQLYAQARLVVAPIFWGSGIRIKLLEALACALPIVTTPQAAEGIALQHGQNALIAGSATTFSTMIVQLLEDAAQCQQLGASGRALIEREYDWTILGQRLVTRYTRARTQRMRSQRAA